jgi:hypothetical protein
MSKNPQYGCTKTDRFPAHPCHRLLMDPDNDNQWLFGDHLVHGGDSGFDLVAGV